MLRFVVLFSVSMSLCIIVVNAQETPPQFTGEQDYFVEAFVDTQSPFTGQVITYTLRYYASAFVANLFTQLPEFDGFWLNDVSELITPRVETINNRQYNVMEIFAELVPVQAGQIMIEPARLEVPQTLFDDAFILETSPLLIDAMPLPEPAPAGFVDAVGQFDMTLAIDTDSTTVGQPIVLRAVITGAGNLELATIPDLQENAVWRDYVNDITYRDSNVGGLRLGERQIEWLIIPDQAGTQTVPTVEFIYFDTQLSDYRVLDSPEFTVEVFPSDSGERPVILEEIAQNDTSLAQRNVNDMAFGETGVSWWFWLIWLVPPIILIAVIGYRRINRLMDERRTEQARKHALSRAIKRLEAINPQSAMVSKELESVIIAFIHNKTGEKITDIQHTPNVITSHLGSEDSDQMIALIKEVESVRYVPSQAMINIPQILKDMQHILEGANLRWREK